MFAMLHSSASAAAHHQQHSCAFIELRDVGCEDEFGCAVAAKLQMVLWPLVGGSSPLCLAIHSCTGFIETLQHTP
jgi:hypothetical protein